MASSAVIRVYVLEGQYAQLSTLGFPASLLLELQERSLRLDIANGGRLTARMPVFRSHSFVGPAARTPGLDVVGAGKGEGSQNLS